MIVTVDRAVDRNGWGHVGCLLQTICTQARTQERKQELTRKRAPTHEGQLQGVNLAHLHVHASAHVGTHAYMRIPVRRPACEGSAALHGQHTCRLDITLKFHNFATQMSSQLFSMALPKAWPTEVLGFATIFSAANFRQICAFLTVINPHDSHIRLQQRMSARRSTKL